MDLKGLSILVWFLRSKRLPFAEGDSDIVGTLVDGTRGGDFGYFPTVLGTLKKKASPQLL